MDPATNDDENLPFPCICGKRYKDEKRLKQHQRYYCHPDQNENCPICPRIFPTYSGMRQHFRLAHPEEYNRDLEGEAYRPKRRLSKSDFDEDAAMELARHEARYKGRHINIYLASVTEEFTLEEITKFRKKNDEYKILVNDLKGLPYNPNPPASPSSSSSGEEEADVVFEEISILPSQQHLHDRTNFLGALQRDQHDLPSTNTRAYTHTNVETLISPPNHTQPIAQPEQSNSQPTFLPITHTYIPSTRTSTQQSQTPHTHAQPSTQSAQQSDNQPAILSNTHTHVPSTQTSTQQSRAPHAHAQSVTQSTQPNIHHLDQRNHHPNTQTSQHQNTTRMRTRSQRTQMSTYPNNDGHAEGQRVILGGAHMHPAAIEAARQVPGSQDPDTEPSVAEKLKKFIKNYYEANDNKWDDDDKELLTMITNDTDQELKVQALEIWLRPIYSKINSARQNKNPGNKTKNKTNKRKNNKSTETGGARGRNYAANAERAFQFKKVQEKFKKNTAQLAADIFDGNVNPDDDNNKDLPDIQIIEDRYMELFGTQSPEDGHPFEGGQPQRKSLMGPIQEEEVMRAVASTKSNAAGPDGVSLTELRKISTNKLVLFFNAVLVAKCPPPSLVRARTTLIPKGPISADVDKWRPITVTSILLRVLGRILGSRMDALQTHPHQRGFKKIDGCFINNLALEHIIKTSRKRAKPHVVITLDLRKAFDMVSHHSMVRALRRAGAEEEFIDYVKNTYKGATTTVSCMGRNTNEIPVNRGVRQGDPLSPFLFNLVVDELIYKLEKSEKGLTCEDGSKLACLGYADDLVILADNTRNAQALLNLAGSFFSDRNLQVNVDKCTSMTAATVPAKKKLFIATTAALCIAGRRIPVITPSTSFKYLGFHYGMMGLSWEHSVKDLGEQLGRLQKAPLKPAQKLFLLKRFLIPRYIHCMQNPKINIKALCRADKAIRKFVKKAVHLHITCPDAYLYATTKEGGLGVPCLRALIPSILLHRLEGMMTTSDVSVLRIINLSTCKKFYENIEKYTEKYGRTSANIKRSWSDTLERSYSGNGVRQGSADSNSGCWIDFPPPYWSGRDFVEAVQLRGNALPTIGIPSNPREKRNCRAGCNRVESLSHVLQKCPVTHWKRIRRHDNIVSIVRKEAEAKGFRVETEPRIRSEEGLKKPDLVIINQDNLTVVDVGVHWEGPRSLRASYQNKITHYSSRGFVEALKRRYGAEKNISVQPLIVGARGIWCDLNKSIVRTLGLSNSTVRRIVLAVIRDSCAVHRDFMRLVWARE